MSATVRITDAMVRADQPPLEVADGATCERHHGRNALAQVAPDGLSPGHVLDARDHGRLCDIRDHGHPYATRDAITSFNRHHHTGGLAPCELATAAQAGLRPTHPGVVDLHVAMPRLTRDVDHRALQQKGRDAPCVGDGQRGRPEPHRERRLRVQRKTLLSEKLFCVVAK